MLAATYGNFLLTYKMPKVIRASGNRPCAGTQLGCRRAPRTSHATDEPKGPYMGRMGRHKNPNLASCVHLTPIGTREEPVKVYTERQTSLFWVP